MLSSYLNSEIFRKSELFLVFTEEYLLRIPSDDENIFPMRNIEKISINNNSQKKLLLILQFQNPISCVSLAVKIIKYFCKGSFEK